jgi:hypothetical protein
MSPLEAASLAATTLVGLALGMTGAGGAILLVPLMVYGMGVPAERAAGQSAAVLALVGAVGAVQSWRKGELGGSEFWAYLPGVAAGAWTGRALLVEALPPAVVVLGRTWPRGSYLMLALAGVMAAASVALVRKPGGTASTARPWAGIVAGMVVGLLTGVLGAGGGFLLVPALVLASRMEARRAAGTSLALVACGTAVAGATELLRHGGEAHWPRLGLIVLGAGTGLAAGLKLRSRTPQDSLRTIMAALIFLVAVAVSAREALFPAGP